MERFYFPNINFLRAAAALLVVVYHVIELTAWSSFPSNGAFLAFHLGWLGVDLFFVISGFVIGLAAIKLYRDSSQSGEGFRKVFMRRRLARIVPLYIFTGAIFLFLVEPYMFKGKIENLAAHVAAHLGFVHNWFVKTHGSINGPNWSVAAEMQFYVIAIVLTPLLSRVKPWKILFWGILIAWLSRFGAYWYTMGRADIHRTFIFASQVPGMADEFAARIFLARLYLDGTLRAWVEKWRHSRVVLIAGSAVLVYVFHTGMMSLFRLHPQFWDNVFMVTFWRTSVALTFVMVVAFFSLLPDLTKTWSGKPFHYLGEISYGIYLWHLPVIVSLKRVIPADNQVLLLNWTIVLTLALAAMSWHLFEKPMMQRLR